MGIVPPARCPQVYLGREGPRKGERELEGSCLARGRSAAISGLPRCLAGTIKELDSLQVELWGVIIRAWVSLGCSLARANLVLVPRNGEWGRGRFRSQKYVNIEDPVLEHTN